MRALPRIPCLLLTALPAVLMTACAALKAEPRSPLFERVGKSDMSVGELRIRVRDMARRFPAVLEATADDISARSGSAQVREAMTRFKSNAVPAMQGALLQPDPVAALIDAWALLAQLEQALPELAPEAQPERLAIARRSLEEMESQVEELWRELTGREDVSPLRQSVHGWASEHPLTGPIIARESTVPLLADFTDRSGVGLLGTAAAALADTQDLVARLDLYAGSLPRQARWQAELAARNAMEAPRVDAAMSELERAVAVLVRMGALASNAPAWVAGEREQLQDFLASQRQAVLRGVQNEREALLQALHSERVQALNQAEAMGRDWMDQAFHRAESLVDRIFFWLLGLLVLFLLGLLGAVVLLSRAWRRAGRVPGGRARGGREPPGGWTPPRPEEAHAPPGGPPGEPHH